MRIFLPLLTLVAGLALGWWGSSAKNGGNGTEPGSSGAAALQTPPRPPSNPGTTGHAGDAQHIPELLHQAFDPRHSGYAAVKPLMQALLSMSPDNLSDFTRFFSAQPLERQQIHLWGMFFSAWAEFDPDAAIAFIDGRFPENATRRMFYAAVMATWGEGSIEEVLEFASRKFIAADGEGGAELALAYLRSVAEKDPASAAAMARQLGDGEFVLELVGRQIAELVKEDREAALAAIDGLEGEAHTFAAGQFMMEWAKQDPSAAGAWLVEHFTPDLGTPAIAGVAAQYFERDPKSALRWIETLPEGVPREKVVAGAVANWLQSDAPGAIAWLRETEVPSIYDRALVAAGNRVAAENPQEVMEQWVPRITEPSLGNELLYEVSLTWQRDDPVAYGSWLQGTEALAPETKQRLLLREVPGADAANTAPSGQPAPAPLDAGRGDSDG